MYGLVVHPATTTRIEEYLVRPAHALLVSGPAGIGKASLARGLAAALLAVDIEKLDRQPYLRHIGGSETDKAIPIEAVRELAGFLSRKVPGDARRVVIIESAERLTAEAQNALLKTLEEPPRGTTLLLTASNEQALLPTIRSRAARLSVGRPPREQITQHFAAQGYDVQRISQAMLMSGGLPGVMQALLSGDDSHPLLGAAEDARSLASKPTFERLAMVDVLAKDREHCMQVLSMLEQMAHVAILRGNTAEAWQRMLSASYAAGTQLRASAQPKLVLTNLMLSL